MTSSHRLLCVNLYSIVTWRSRWRYCTGEISNACSFYRRRRGCRAGFSHKVYHIPKRNRNCSETNHILCGFVYLLWILHFHLLVYLVLQYFFYLCNIYYSTWCTEVWCCISPPRVLKSPTRIFKGNLVNYKCGISRCKKTLQRHLKNKDNH